MLLPQHGVMQGSASYKGRSTYNIKLKTTYFEIFRISSNSSSRTIFDLTWNGMAVIEVSMETIRNLV
jgi:hypothetical protein